MNLLSSQFFLVTLVSLLAWPITASAVQHTKWTIHYVDNGTSKIETSRFSKSVDSPAELIETVTPQYIIEHEDPVDGPALHILSSTNLFEIEQLLERRNVLTEKLADAHLSLSREVTTIVSSGPSENRIDLVFMGDGYLLEQKEKFMADMKRLVDDLFTDDTFSAYLPLFNVHLVFEASQEEGIPRNNPGNTAYGLYRPGNTLRSIMPGNSGRIRAACRAAPDCDYPIVIANDPNYGGLGGEFAIATSSETSGTIVLRHELGHNFGRVGEEYDGGSYFGANHSSSLRGLKWKAWLTENETKIKAQPSVARFLGWPWHNLSNGDFIIDLNSNGQYDYASLRVSVSGIETPETLSVSLDGASLDFPSPNRNDRSFVNLFFDTGFAKGSHKVKFSENTKDGNNWVSSVAIHEYGAGYQFDPGYVGAYPVFDQGGNVSGYRSNHEACLMRNMNSRNFCVVCTENNWLQFFNRLDLIDSTNVIKNQNSYSASIDLLPLGQFRDSLVDGEYFLISWFQGQTEREDLRGKTTVSVEKLKGLKVKVEFKSQQIRSQDQKLLTQTHIFSKF